MKPVIIIILIVLCFMLVARFLVKLNSTSLVPPTPPPITPIAPPAGIRDILIYNPHHLHLLEATRDNSGSTLLSDPGGLHQCYATDEMMLEAYSQSPNEFVVFVTTQVCGWQKANAPVVVRLSMPDGSHIERTVTTRKPAFRGDRISVSIAEHVPITDPESVISIEFSGEDGVFSAENTYHLPKSPRAYLYKSGDVWLYGFEPQESVQLLRYDVSERGTIEGRSFSGITEIYKLVATDSVTIEADGTRLLREFASAEPSPYGSNSIVVAVGGSSGEVKSSGSMPFVEDSVFAK